MARLSSEPSGTRLMLATFSGVQSSGESANERAGVKQVFIGILFALMLSVRGDLISPDHMTYWLLLALVVQNFNLN